MRETLIHGHGDMETETCKHGDIDMRHGEMEIWRHRYMDMETWTWRHGNKILGNSDVSRRYQTENGIPGV
jgi:hypothetical protein